MQFKQIAVNNASFQATKMMRIPSTFFMHFFNYKVGRIGDTLTHFHTFISRLTSSHGESAIRIS